MLKDNNGFQDMLDYTSRLSQVDPQKVTLESLNEAAQYFVDKLLPNIPRSLMKKKHMKDHIKVDVEDDKVTIYFEDTSFYWRFVENGTVNMKAQHFVEGTWQQQKSNVEDIMTKKIIKEMEGK
ncbi:MULTISPECIES: HK97-gp10 family putative phage morphogenesis protein [Lactococcus]|uniref:HK97-gp10 family putative phage morphogenesis protein n=1 Tax=Lactococcus TaxID=1357 RepID=UPI001596CAAE|nr:MULTISPECIES: HK97-gp10 family putative phage morphogenesis protein [Lactococcus]MCH1713170.1 HK97 gp10 family phage protein [Lactococcus petauri]MDT2593688.1 HK97 gp10 family phage protein [Lactococcus petauri]QQC74217.1 HK97 gp10 family phage protein [Lactococcus garvieae]